MATLRIEHRSLYTYTRPVSFGRHRLVLRPREGHDQRVVSMKLELSPAHHLIWSRDLFGNSVALVEFHEAADRLEIVSEVVVHRTAPFPAEHPHEPWSVPYPLVYDPLETTIADAYRQLTYRDDEAKLRKWLRDVLPKPPADAESVIAALGAAVHGAVKYIRRSEKGVQTPVRTLEVGTGSCRDLSTLMLDAARLLGLAARFASGYLDCAASTAGRASTHAWVEVYLPDLGWRGYDPTIGEPTSLKHIVTGVSNHPRGVMPVSGRYLGDAADFRELVVSVKTEAVAMSP
jgi:transglutaminase-like putative cysteine protease